MQLVASSSTTSMMNHDSLTVNHILHVVYCALRFFFAYCVLRTQCWFLQYVNNVLQQEETTRALYMIVARYLHIIYEQYTSYIVDSRTIIIVHMISQPVVSGGSNVVNSTTTYASFQLIVLVVLLVISIYYILLSGVLLQAFTHYYHSNSTQYMHGATSALSS